MTGAETSIADGFNRRAIPREATETRWTARDGQAIRRIDWLIPHGAFRGSLLFTPGRGDAYEKYVETLDYWHRRGWRVTAADWRGQAGSGRLGRDQITGHIGDFSVWMEDLAELWERWKRNTPPPHVLVGHSMGGHLVLRALAEARVDPQAAVLIAPMLGFRPAWIPRPVMQLAARLMTALGDPRRPAWKWGERPGVLPAGRMKLLTHDEGRYADEIWWREARPEIAMGPGSWGWIERAYASISAIERPGALERAAMPVLILATNQDGLVDFSAIDRAARRLVRGELVLFGAEARHEILRETDDVRDRALAAIDVFFNRAAPLAD